MEIDLDCTTYRLSGRAGSIVPWMPSLLAGRSTNAMPATRASTAPLGSGTTPPANEAKACADHCGSRTAVECARIFPLPEVGDINNPFRSSGIVEIAIRAQKGLLEPVVANREEIVCELHHAVIVGVAGQEGVGAEPDGALRHVKQEGYFLVVGDRKKRKGRGIDVATVGAPLVGKAASRGLVLSKNREYRSSRRSSTVRRPHGSS